MRYLVLLPLLACAGCADPDHSYYGDGYGNGRNSGYAAPYDSRYQYSNSGYAAPYDNRYQYSGADRYYEYDRPRQRSFWFGMGD